MGLWDGVTDALRVYLRAEGLREVATPTVIDAPAVEPYIEPSRIGVRFLRTSPELALKRLLCHGSGSIYELAAVFREGESGPHHLPEFHLLEWYRVGASLRRTMTDVESMVAAARQLGGGVAPRWRVVSLLERMGEDLGRPLRGDESAGDLAPLLARVSSLAAVALRRREATSSEESVARLEAWTELYTLWSTRMFDPWLRALGPDHAVHLVAFPAPLAALSQVLDGVAQRFESFVGGVELANGYLELADPTEQRRRFEAVNGLRGRAGAQPLPVDEAFLADLRHPGLPDCAGVALGMDRLVMVAAAATSLAEIRYLPDRA
ncbi:MAG: amino acid--tRNA ligase-related protein [Nannocystaceae bacterium]